MKILIGALIILVLLALLAGNIMSRVEQPKYKTVDSKGSFEIREYSPMIVAEVEITADRKTAIKEGFRALADYIFGNNTSHTRIAMTAPVLQEGSKNSWQIRFTMPHTYTLETLPAPICKNIHIKSLESKKFAAIQFSGIATDKSLEKNLETLKNILQEKNITIIGKPILAFYNPPWTLPFLRRNEILIEIKP